MATSQHRPGVSVALSPASYVKEKLKIVETIESQLSDLPPSSSKNTSITNKHVDEQASRLRVKLCQILSDIILTCPSVSVENNCLERLWRHCFYNPIGLIRSRLSREKRKKGPHVKRIEKSLEKHLFEAINLYDFMVVQFHDKIKGVAERRNPNSQDSSSQSQGQSQSSYGQLEPTTVDMAGVVPNLFRMYIHLGDLHRYAAEYEKSQSNYFQASKLAPGMGNPYNQLAVVAQLKDADAPLNCVALYWYARALLSDEPFEIAKGNLARLFQSNREWFRKQPSPTDEVLQPKPGDGNKGGATGGRDMSRAHRTAASRHFLAMFVDLHFSLFQGISANSLLHDDDEIVQQIKSISGHFSLLLKASAFGDKLICRMIAICSFSEIYNPVTSLQQSDPADAAVNRQREKAERVTSMLARTLTLAFGACLAEHAILGLTKIKDKPESMGNPGKAPPSVRLMLPLLLVCEFVESHAVNFDDALHEEISHSLSAKTKDFCANTLEKFWQQVAEVMNILTNLRATLQLDKENWQQARLSEYQNYLGFSPFQSFLGDNRASTRIGGYVSVEEAADVLELRGANPSSHQDVNVPKVEEYKIKVARFLAFGDRAADLDKNSRFIRNANGSYVWRDKEEDKDDMDLDEDFNHDNFLMDGCDSKPPINVRANADELVGDMLVYKEPVGGGPPLLVPGMLLQNRAFAAGSSNAHTSKTGGEQNIFQDKLANSSPSAFAPVDENDLAVSVTGPAKDGHKSPGAAPVLAMKPSVPQQLHRATGSSFVATNIIPPPGFGATMPPPGVSREQGGGVVLPGFAQGTTAVPILVQQAVGYQQQHAVPTLGDSLHLFGGSQDCQTNNPFAGASIPSHDVAEFPSKQQIGVAGIPLGNIDNDASSPGTNNAGVAESSLLGTGLLTSLWMDGSEKVEKPTTRNPFS